jgi:glycine C-acetyltransferase
MNKQSFLTNLHKQTQNLKSEGLYKTETIITSSQSSNIMIEDVPVLNFCANNYLGLANHPDLIAAGQEGLEKYGFGVASVRFICGTQDIHQELESKISDFLSTEETILYSSCYDANGGLFETILTSDDAVISDALNHASIIDGVRLCKAKRYRYENNNILDLEEQLKQADAAGARVKLIATDGVFSMDGVIADLKQICDLADKYKALVMVDDSHAVGLLGKKGRGTAEYCDVLGRIDILTGTLGKALGGASGGYISGRKEIIDWLRQRSRPYLFSNSLSPSITFASIQAIEILKNGDHIREKLWENVSYFRKMMTAAGFDLAGKDHAIIPIMLGNAKVAAKMAEQMILKQIHVVGFSFPVVPKEKARIRVQISAAHTKEQLDKAITAFITIGQEMAII